MPGRGESTIEEQIPHGTENHTGARHGHRVRRDHGRVALDNGQTPQVIDQMTCEGDARTALVLGLAVVMSLNRYPSASRSHPLNPSAPLSIMPRPGHCSGRRMRALLERPLHRPAPWCGSAQRLRPGSPHSRVLILGESQGCAAVPIWMLHAQDHAELPHAEVIMCSQKVGIYIVDGCAGKLRQ